MESIPSLLRSIALKMASILDVSSLFKSWDTMYVKVACFNLYCDLKFFKLLRAFDARVFSTVSCLANFLNQGC